jgi:hypothetical protein
MILLALRRAKAPRRILLVLGVLPPAGLLLASPNLRVYGYHGLVQAGIVHQLDGYRAELVDGRGEITAPRPVVARPPSRAVPPC